MNGKAFGPCSKRCACFAIALVILTFGIFVTPLSAQLSYTGSSLSQDFNSLGTSGTNTWSNNTTLLGWYAYHIPATAPVALPTYLGDNGSLGNGSLYSYGSSSTPNNRALGSIGAGTAYWGTPASGAIAGWFAVGITNNSGLAQTAFTTNYLGEEWRYGGTTGPQTMTMEYGFGSTFGSVTTWTAPGAGFNFTTPVTSGTTGALDGTLAANQAALGGTISTAWATGQTLWIRWDEVNDVGVDDAMAIDNFSFSSGAGNVVTPTLYWAGDGAHFGGPGTWDASTSNTWSTTNLTVTPTNWNAGNSPTNKVASFGGATAGMVTVTGAVNAGLGLSFTTDGYILNPGSGGKIVLTGPDANTNSINTDPGVTATINAVLDGTAGMTKVGSGTLILTATNTYTDGTTITSGTLQIGNGGTTGSIVGDITVNGTLAFNRSDTVTFSANLSGTGFLRQVGSGTLKIVSNLASTFQGGTIVDAGTLQIGDGTGNGTLAGGITLNGTSSLVFDTPGTTTYAGPITGTGSLTIIEANPSNPSTLILTGASNYTGGSTIPAGATLQVGNGGTTGTLFGNVSDSGSLVYDRTTTSGTGSIGLSDTLTGSGTLVQMGIAPLVITGAVSPGGGTTIGGSSTIQIGNGSNSGSLSGNVSMGTFSSLIFDRSDNTSFAGAITETGSQAAVSNIGAGVVTFSSANTYSGGTTISGGGGFKATVNNALGSNGIFVSNGKVLANGGVTISNPITVNPSSTPAAGGLLAFWNFDNFTPHNGDPTSSIPGMFNTSPSGVGASEIYDGTSKLINPTAGAKTSSYVDFSHLNGTMGSAAAPSWGTFGGTTVNQVTGGPTSGAFVVNGDGNDNGDNPGHYLEFETSTTGFHGLVATYATRYSGTTAYSTQTWSYSTDNLTFTPLPTTVTVNSTSFTQETVDFSGITALDNQSTVYLRVAFSGYTDASPTLLTSTGNNRIDNVQFNALPYVGYVPNVQLGSDDTSGTAIYSNSVSLNSDVALTAAAGGTVNFSGGISGGSSTNYVVKTGAGTVLLSTPESYSGITSVLQGTLKLGIAHAIDSSSGVSMGGGTLATQGNNQSFGLLNLAASSTIDMGNAGTVSFTASSSTTGAVGVWTLGAILRISNWKGNASNPTISPAQTPFEVGNSPSTKLNSTELSQIHFTGYLTGAQELTDFEIVPLSTTRLLLGDVDRNQHVNASDIVAMETAFSNLSSYQTSHSFDSADMSDIFDVNGDGKINNADLQALETYLIGGHGSLGVPEPSSVVLGLLGTVSLAGIAFRRRRQMSVNG